MLKYGTVKCSTTIFITLDLFKGSCGAVKCLKTTAFITLVPMTIWYSQMFNNILDICRCGLVKCVSTVFITLVPMPMWNSQGINNWFD